MKKIGLLVLAVLLILSLVACGEGSPDGIPAGMKVASDEKNVPYRLCVPEGWQINYGTDGAIDNKGWSMAQSTEGDRTNVVVSYHSNRQITPYSDALKTVTEYYNGNTEYEGMRKKLEALFDKTENGDGTPVSSFTVEHETDKPEITAVTVKKGSDGEVAAGKVIYSGTIGGTPVKQVLVMIFHDDYFINITFSMSPAFYDSSLDTVNGILAAFMLK